MIEQVTMYTVVCDGCGCAYEDKWEGFCAWTDELGAIESAMNDDWIEEAEKHYCPYCYEYDDNDNLIIKHKNKQQ